MYKTNKNKLKQKRLALAAAVAVLAISAGVVLYLKNDNSLSTGENPGSVINYNPPTKEELVETKDRKDTITKEAGTAKDIPATSQESSATNKVVPVITSWSYSDSFLRVSGFVPGVIESTGTCTVIAENGSLTATGVSQGTPNAQNVSCGLIKIPRSELGIGTWKITLKYSSTEHSGTSESQSQEVD